MQVRGDGRGAAQTQCEEQKVRYEFRFHD
jgi:hypothetical protein